MIQDIFPSRLDNSFKQKNISSDDVLICFDSEGRLLVSVNDGSISFGNHKLAQKAIQL